MSNLFCRKKIKRMWVNIIEPFAGPLKFDRNYSGNLPTLKSNPYSWTQVKFLNEWPYKYLLHCNSILFTISINKCFNNNILIICSISSLKMATCIWPLIQWTDNERHIHRYTSRHWIFLLANTRRLLQQCYTMGRS